MFPLPISTPASTGDKRKEFKNRSVVRKSILEKLKPLGRMVKFTTPKQPPIEPYTALPPLTPTTSSVTTPEITPEHTASLPRLVPLASLSEGLFREASQAFDGENSDTQSDMDRQREAPAQSTHAALLRPGPARGPELVEAHGPIRRRPSFRSGIPSPPPPSPGPPSSPSTLSRNGNAGERRKRDPRSPSRGSVHQLRVHEAQQINSGESVYSYSSRAWSSEAALSRPSSGPSRRQTQAILGLDGAMDNVPPSAPEIPEPLLPFSPMRNREASRFQPMERLVNVQPVQRLGDEEEAFAYFDNLDAATEPVGSQNSLAGRPLTPQTGARPASGKLAGPYAAGNAFSDVCTSECARVVEELNKLRAPAAPLVLVPLLCAMADDFLRFLGRPHPVDTTGPPVADSINRVRRAAVHAVNNWLREMRHRESSGVPVAEAAEAPAAKSNRKRDVLTKVFRRLSSAASTPPVIAPAVPVLPPRLDPVAGMTKEVKAAFLAGEVVGGRVEVSRPGLHTPRQVAVFVNGAWRPEGRCVGLAGNDVGRWVLIWVG